MLVTFPLTYTKVFMSGGYETILVKISREETITIGGVSFESCTVMDIKHVIQDVCGKPTYHQRLLFHMKSLEDYRTLDYYLFTLAAQ